jgi:3-oxoacyl-[acyl-carrier-protein] synthase II
MPSEKTDRADPRRRIVITGLGAVTPLGIGAEAYWQALCAGRSGVGPLTRFDPAGFDVQIAAEVHGFEATDFLSRRDARRMDRFAHFATAAALMALEDAQLPITAHNAERVGVLIGSGAGGLSTLDSAIADLARTGPGRVSPLLVSMMVQDSAAGHVSILTGAKGPNSTVVTACATGAHALGDALEILRRGAADVMIAGGAECAITPLVVASFGNARAMTARFNDDPTRASRPFDRDRDGFVMGEGAGILILETLEHAERRGAPHLYAELVGYGMSGDAYHIMQSAPGGEGIARALRAALQDADVAPEQVDHINAHGTSTVLGDLCETQAYKSVFGTHASRVAISATKSMTGHLLGAAGAIEGIASVLAIDRGCLPPTINFEHADPECDLDYVPNQARDAHPDVVLSNSSGFGGHNAALVFRRLT